VFGESRAAGAVTPSTEAVGGKAPVVGVATAPVTLVAGVATIAATPPFTVLFREPPPLRERPWTTRR
jgi:hypothetical protein